ncbi:fatty acyl-CoA reductase 1-like [Maniola jurtina]|uniref:fatty acyl-CoA reductase 1-like n=1 Tax=Maniola jurtina TaxID=191418 RepID=UPI001E68B2C7|nr:fatty acyl-CoA reductase 1-like [Maniola jurtina]
MTFLEDRDLEDVPSIPEYYKGKTVFITGGSGFMGKVLVEKLLYSCTDLDRIYLLVRPKRGVTPENRLAEIFASRCFDRLREERPGVFESKVFFIAGDCSEVALGLSEEDRALLLNRTNIIYHVAASVRFDDPLKKAVKLNLRGTVEMIELAKEVQNLESFIHVSTTYSNTNRNPIEEILYPPLADWRETLEICENIEEQTLNSLTPKFLGEMANTYVLCKQLAEHVVYEQRGKLPVVIIRPSIVLASVKEPAPGWIENFNGPVGLIVASGKGILRTLYADPLVSGDYIPVDVAIKGFIAASWTRGTKKLEPSDDTPIYNVCNGQMGYHVTAEEILSIGHKITDEVPLDNVVWTAGGAITDNKYLYYVYVIMLQLLPAILIDTLLWLLGKKTMLVKIQRRVYVANLAIAYFLTHTWTFSNENFMSLRSKILDKDKLHFYYIMENIDMYEYLKTGIMGGRRYLLNEKDENLPKARAHYKRMAILDTLVKCLFYGYIVWRIINSSLVCNLFG